MPEATLAIKVAELEAEVGEYLGWGRGANYQDKPWKKDQYSRIKSCVRSGLRRFYYPDTIRPGAESYDWSFLKPVSQIYFPASTKFVVLPDDFGSPEGDLTVSSSITQTIWPVEITNIGRINHYYQVTPTTVGRPLVAAITPSRNQSASQSQQWELWIYPITDQDYTFNLQYYINPGYLTGDTPYAYGGPQHHETILESCLAVAEQREDDLPNGPHQAEFVQRLAASISIDRRLKPMTLGPNLDRSDWEGRWDREALHWLNTVTYNGQPIGGGG